MATSLPILRTYNLLVKRNILSCPLGFNSGVLFTSCVYSSKTSDTGEGDPNDPMYAKWKAKPHPETPTNYHIDKLSPQPVKGKIYEKFPLRVLLEAGKNYSFCTCGYSKTQPFCDSSHKAPNFASTRPHHIRYRPLPFTVEETKEYWLCMCKQSNNRPFCDATHKRQDIQEAKI